MPGFLFYCGTIAGNARPTALSASISVNPRPNAFRAVHRDAARAMPAHGFIRVHPR